MKEDRMVYVVDDDPSVCKSLERLLSTQDFHVVTFLSGQEFLSIEKYHYPCCLILDVKLPGISGPELHQELIRKGVGIPIIFITGHGDIPMSVRAMKDGAVDFLPKPFNHKDLLEAVGRGLDLSSSFQKEWKEKQKIQELLNTLTAREHEVLRCVITGRLNKQIGSTLGISEKTVKVHRGRIMQKLQLFSVAELVRLADKMGITPIH